MVDLGYAISSEEVTPLDAVRNAQRAEAAGFPFALISDHYHPWIDQQGHSPFVWGVLGGIAQATERLRIGTGVTCPTVRIHPAIIAQAAATAAALMPGRFFLGVGSGENLNEHITGRRWPPYDLRARMLEEAVAVIRKLWTGETVTHYGEFYTVEEARIYSLPDELPPIVVAAGGQASAELAGRLGDGLVSTAPEAGVVRAFQSGSDDGRPRYGQVTVCWAEREAEARTTAAKWWPTAALHGELTQELRTPTHFEQAVKSVTEDQVAELIACGPNPQKHLDAIQKFVDAGFDHVYVHQVGPNQEGFFRFYEENILPEFS